MNQLITEIEPLLKVEMFSSTAHQIIFDCMIDIHNNKEPIDLITITEKLRAIGHLEDIGDISYITSLSTIVPTTSNISHYANIILEKI